MSDPGLDGGFASEMEGFTIESGAVRHCTLSVTRGRSHRWCSRCRPQVTPSPVSISSPKISPCWLQVGRIDNGIVAGSSSDKEMNLSALPSICPRTNARASRQSFERDWVFKAGISPAADSAMIADSISALIASQRLGMLDRSVCRR